MAIDDFLLWVTIGIILGGRLGYVLFYKAAYYFAHPSEILHVWEGGMSFHGGLLGVFLAVFLFSKKRKIQFWTLLDLACAAAPIGLFLGRIANFINGELYGRITTHPIGMIFPDGGAVFRHPSQLYEAFLEGMLLFIFLYLAIRYFKLLKRSGVVAGLFGIGYGIARTIAEFFREPDAHLGFIFSDMTMGMLLSIPMIFLGIMIALWRYRNAQI